MWSYMRAVPLASWRVLQLRNNWPKKLHVSGIRPWLFWTVMDFTELQDFIRPAEKLVFAPS
jgi:hypothetical protein